MNYSELCRLKDKLLLEARKNTRPEDFSNYEDYQLYMEGVEEGIMRFFTKSMMEIIDEAA
jgi:hypothetical protein